MSDVFVSPSDLPNYGAIMAGASAPAQAQANIAQTQANTQVLQQQAQAAGIQNQKAALGLSLYKGALASFYEQQQSNLDKSGVAADSSTDDPHTSFYDQENTDQQLRNRFFVNPAGTPSDQNALKMAALSGDPGLLEYAKQQRDLNVMSQTAQAQRDANSLFDSMSSIANAPPGLALQTLARIAPNTAKSIQAALPDSADEDLAARNYASHVSSSVHQYSGRPVEADGAGVYRDKVTGQPIPGTAVTGLSSDQYAQLAAKGNEIVSLPSSTGAPVSMPRWQATGFPTLSAWVQRMVAQRGVPAAQPGAAPSYKDAVANAADTAAAAATKAAAQQNGGQAPGPTSTDPVMKAALADTSYRLPATKARIGVGQSPAQQKEAEAIAGARTSLLQDTNGAIPAAQMSKTFLTAAQDILDTQGASTGKWSSLIANAGRWVPGGIPASSNYLEMSKFLGNAALQSAKATFPRLTQLEAKMALEELNPSPNMPEAALRNMITTGLRNSDYIVQSARRARVYSMAGNDPRSFYDWNANYFPQDKAVNGPQTGNTTPTNNTAPTGNGSSAPVLTATGPNGKKLYLRNGQWAAK